jgi:hypothetical protein
VIWLLNPEQKIKLEARLDAAEGAANCLVSILKQKESYDQAVGLCKVVLARRKERLGRGHHDTLNTHLNLADLIHSQGDLDMAKIHYSQGLMAAKPLGMQHGLTWTFSRRLETRYHPGLRILPCKDLVITFRIPFIVALIIVFLFGGETQEIHSTIS